MLIYGIYEIIDNSEVLLFINMTKSIYSIKNNIFKLKNKKDSKYNFLNDHDDIYIKIIDNVDIDDRLKLKKIISDYITNLNPKYRYFI